MKQAVDKAADAALSLVGSDHNTLSTGAPVGDNRNSLTAGSRGPVLLQDHVFLEKVGSPCDGTPFPSSPPLHYLRRGLFVGDPCGLFVSRLSAPTVRRWRSLTGSASPSAWCTR
jgi:hypothetical protein